MRKRLLSALLAMAMVLTMLPMSAFAATGDSDATVAPEVEAFGFAWEAKAPDTDLDGDGDYTYKAGKDWMAQTMWVALKEGATAGQNLWFEVQVGKDKWGCAATTSTKQMFAFSFLNRGSQWELHPTIAGQEFKYSDNASATHATEYMKAGEVTLSVYSPETAIEGEQQTAPTEETLGKAIWTKTFNITADIDIVEVVEDAPVAVNPVFTAATEAVFAGKKASQVQTVAENGGMKIEKAASGNYVVTGVTLKHIEGWKEFNPALEAEQSGYYLAIAVPQKAGDATITGMKLQGKTAQGDPETKTYEGEQLTAAFTDGTAENQCCNIFFYMGADAKSLKKTTSIELKYGAGEYVTYTFDLSQVGVEGVTPPVDPSAPETGVVAAPLEDHGTGDNAVAGPLVKESTYAATAGTAETEGKVITVPVTLKAEDLKEHTNTQPAKGYWVGVGVLKVDGNTYAQAWKAVASGAEYKATGDSETTVDEKDYVTFYFNIDNHNLANDKGVVSVKNGEYTINYVITFDVSKYVAPAPGLKVTTATGTVLNKEVSKLHGALTIAEADANKVIKVTGAANYVIGWTDFSSVTEPVNEQNGNYVAIKLEVTPAGKISIKRGNEWIPLDPDGIVVARLKDTDAANKIEVALGETNAQKTADYTIDLTGVTKKPVEITNVTKADGDLNVSYANGKVYVAGQLIEKSTEDPTGVEFPHNLALKVTVDGVQHDVTAVIAKAQDGTLSIADVDFHNTKLTFDASGLFLKNPESTAAPAVTDPAVVAPEFEDEDKQEAAESAATAIAGANTAVDTTVLTNVAAQLANKETTKPETVMNNEQKEELAAVEVTADKPLAKIQTAVAAGTEEKFAEQGVELVVNVYTKIEIADIEPATTPGAAPATLKLSITPMAQTVLTTDKTDIKVLADDATNKNEANAVVVKEEPAKVDVPTVVTIQLPDSYAEATYIIQHEKNGVNYYYEGTVNASHVLTFTSLHGFSDFTIHATDPRVAQIGEVKYEKLADAVAAVKDGETIVLLKACAENVTVSREVSFTLNVNGQTFTGKIEAGSGYENKSAVEHTYQFEKKSSTNPGPIGGGGGASGTTTYSVNVPTTANGTVTVNPRNAAKDATVTITVAPNQGYHLDTLTVTDKDGNTVELTKVDSNKYTFKMPASRVEIKATFVEGEAPAISFTDVVEGEYYVDAVKWAVDKGITNGLTDTTFGPNASCTRAQMVTFLWRAAGSPEPTTTTTAFTDVDSNEYYYKAMLWAVEKGITKGTTDTTFAPNATVTRAQTVTFLYRYAGSPAVNGTNAFTDLEANEYYVDAVQWAATNGITTGTTETTFSPANNCTRGQIVTFLYRHIVK